jgi:hypothetical protein
MALFIGPYTVTERMHGGRRLRTYFHPQVAELASLYLTKTSAYIDRYEDRIGAYPYSQFFAVSGVHPVGLGFPGLTYMGTDVLRLPFIPDTSLGHEVLHSWWGNAVLTDAAEGNWAEGLTTFLADYAYAAEKGAGPARDMRLRWLREYAVLPAAADRPLTAFRARHHTASQVVGYHKAAMLFLMLRDEIGPQSFDTGLRRFWTEHRFGSAGWKDLQRAFESAAGRPLHRFFEQWVQRAGAPRLELRDVDVRRQGEGAEVTFELGQPEPWYDLRVPVEIHTAEQTLRQAVRLDGRTGKFRLQVPATPLRLAVDPDFQLFRRLHRDEVPPILRSVAFDPGAATVIVVPDRETAVVARQLATAFFEREPALHEPGAPLPNTPVLVVGTTAAVVEALQAHALPPVPPRVAGEGTARVWALRRATGAAAVVVMADDAAALRAIVKPLPHYGSQSFVVFEGRRAVDRGLMPANELGPLQVVLEPKDEPQSENNCSPRRHRGYSLVVRVHIQPETVLLVRLGLSCLLLSGPRSLYVCVVRKNFGLRLAPTQVECPPHGSRCPGSSWMNSKCP